MIGINGRQIVLITDETVADLHANEFVQELQNEKNNVRMFVFPSGEELKTRDTVFDLQDAILDWGIDRNTLVVGLGGGVVTDVAGFVAASLLRGIEWIAVPTTLLGMVDASMGGKTGVNTTHGKNLVGSFWPPLRAVINPKFLKTLPKKEIQAGVVEMIKHGAIRDLHYFQEMVEAADQVLECDLKVLIPLIDRSVEIKAEIVRQDANEKKGIRQILNFGHTVGHAIELASDYKISHGEAVAIGMVCEARLSGSQEVDRLVQALSRYGLPTELPFLDLFDAMKSDKKSAEGKPQMVVLEEIGRCKEKCMEITKEMLDGLRVHCAN